MVIYFPVYVPESNKRRKLSLKRRRKGPPKELFPATGRPVSATTNEPEKPTFDLGFDLDVQEIEVEPPNFNEGAIKNKKLYKISVNYQQFLEHTNLYSFLN